MPASEPLHISVKKLFSNDMFAGDGDPAVPPIPEHVDARHGDAQRLRTPEFSLLFITLKPRVE